MGSRIESGLVQSTGSKISNKEVDPLTDPNGSTQGQGEKKTRRAKKIHNNNPQTPKQIFI